MRNGLMRAAAMVAGLMVSGLSGAAPAQPFEFIFEYRIATEGADQVFVDEDLAGALVTERIVGDASQRPTDVRVIDQQQAVLYDFDVQRTITITDRPGGGPDLAAGPVAGTIAAFDADPAGTRVDAILAGSTAFEIPELDFPFLSPSRFGTPGLDLVALDADTVVAGCDPTLGELFGSFETRTFDDERYDFTGGVTADVLLTAPVVTETAWIVSAAIAITQQPQTALVPFGTPTVSFGVVADTATEIPTIAYQWRKDGVGLVDGPGVSGANAPTLVVDAVSGSEGVYDCVLTTFSDERITPPAALGFLAPTAQPDCPADQNFNGMLDPGDFTAWIANYNAGCP